MAVSVREHPDDQPNNNATDKLAEFIHANANTMAEADVDRYIVLAKEALARADIYLLNISDISNRAKRLAAAAGKFAKELSAAISLENVQLTNGEAGALKRQGATSIWPYLRIAKLLGEGDFHEDVPSALRYGENSRLARVFDTRVGNPQALLLSTKELEKNASAAATAFSVRKRPPDLRRRRLRAELAMIFRSAFEREPPKQVSQASYDDPRSPFGRFVKLAIETTDWDQQSREEAFVAIVVTGERRVAKVAKNS